MVSASLKFPSVWYQTIYAISYFMLGAEKGLCMRGELCPFDHGTDPVVLEDVVIPGVTAPPGPYSQSLPPDAFGAAAMMRPGMPPVMGTCNITSLKKYGSLGVLLSFFDLGIGEYYPDNPGMDPSWGIQFRPRMGMYH